MTLHGSIVFCMLKNDLLWVQQIIKQLGVIMKSHYRIASSKLYLVGEVTKMMRSGEFLGILRSFRKFFGNSKDKSISLPNHSGHTTRCMLCILFKTFKLVDHFKFLTERQQNIYSRKSREKFRKCKFTVVCSKPFKLFKIFFSFSVKL